MRSLSPCCGPAWHVSVGLPRAAKTQHHLLMTHARQQHRPDSRLHYILHQHISKIYHSLCHSFLTALLFLYAPISLPSSALIFSSFFCSHFSSVYTLLFPLLLFVCLLFHHCALSIKLFQLLKKKKKKKNNNNNNTYTLLAAGSHFRSTTSTDRKKWRELSEHYTSVTRKQLSRYILRSRDPKGYLDLHRRN